MDYSGDSSPLSGRSKRPATVTWLAVAVLFLAGVNAGRAGVPLAGWDLWSAFVLPFPLWLRMVLSGVWAVTLGSLAWGLWTLRSWARRLTLILFPLYQLYELGWRLAFVRSDYERGRLPFVVATMALATLFVVWILTGRRVRHRFERDGQREGNGE